ncbi:DegT/DnrJ/EryC1/StrS family aminotransferase [Patescibacteria group bacterium]|nr:DegT/DnrJ/EryC1/StrS family aminotransferase [Patescibacteria group bacterium]
MTYRIPVSQPSITEVEKRWVNKALDEKIISSTGGLVEQFEHAFAEKIGTRYAVACNSGGSALFLALWALGVKEGDEVIVPDFTMAATANAVIQCGARPVFVDAEWDTCNINPTLVAEKVSERTKVILPVHIYGHPVDISPILQIASQKNIKVVEDAAECHGGEYRARRVGSLGHCACFSFYGTKIVTTGEGGAITTDDSSLADELKRLRGYYFSKAGDFLHKKLGFNLRMSSLEAAFGLGQLERWDELIQKREEIAEYYDKHLKDIVETPVEKDYAKRVNWYYLIKTEKRDEVENALEEHGIETRRAFTPMHLQPYLTSFAKGEAFPVSDRLMNEGMYLPTYPDLSRKEQDEIGGVVKEVLRS